MLTLSQEQLGALADGSRSDFQRRATDHLVKHFPELLKRAGSRETVERYVEDGVEQAASHGIDIELFVVRFLVLRFAFGRRFDDGQQWPEVRRILTDQTLPQGMRVSMVETALSAATTRRQEGKGDVLSGIERDPGRAGGIFGGDRTGADRSSMRIGDQPIEAM